MMEHAKKHLTLQQYFHEQKPKKDETSIVKVLPIAVVSSSDRVLHAVTFGFCSAPCEGR